MAIPDLAVKSFDNSARAFAGSHAAQHSVSCLSWACALPMVPPSAKIAAARLVFHSRMKRHSLLFARRVPEAGHDADNRIYGVSPPPALPPRLKGGPVDRRRSLVELSEHILN